VLLLVVTVAACGTTTSPSQFQGAAPGGLAAPVSPAPSSTGLSIAGPQGSASSASSGPSASLPTLAGGSATTALGNVTATTGAPVHTPIQLGFLDTETGNASAFGANTGSSFTSGQAAQALVAAFNRTGGIDGRKITPIVATTDTATADWSTDYSAACAKFTQDNKVAAVLGYTFAFLDSFESCLSKAGVVHLDDAYNVGDEYDFRQYPLHFGLANPSFDRHYLAQLEGPVATGYITKANKLGVLLSACPYDQRGWNAEGAPYIKAHGLDVVDTETLSCVGGANDDGAAVAQITSAVLKFRSARVDRIIAEGVPVALFGITAEVQGWRPGYVVTSWTGGAVLEGTGLMPAAQEANVHGFGWFPIVDVGAAHAPPLNANQQRCISLYRSEGLVPRQYSDYVTMYTFCDAMFLYEAALRVTNGNSNGALIAGAVEGMGTSYTSVTTLQATFGPAQHDAPTLARPWGWTPSCSCYTYQGPAVPIS
jgi:hypothetical protein